jgi:hypothetical protein
MMSDARQIHWVVWSEEHSSWWRAGGSGYTSSLRLAGRFTESEARKIADKANRYLPGGIFNEVALPDPLAAERSSAMSEHQQLTDADVLDRLRQVRALCGPPPEGFLDLSAVTPVLQSALGRLCGLATMALEFHGDRIGEGTAIGALATLDIRLDEDGFRDLVAGKPVTLHALTPMTADGQDVRLILADIGWDRMEKAIADAERGGRDG